MLCHKHFHRQLFVLYPVLSAFFCKRPFLVWVQPRAIVNKAWWRLCLWPTLMSGCTVLGAIVHFVKTAEAFKTKAAVRVALCVWTQKRNTKDGKRLNIQTKGRCFRCDIICSSNPTSPKAVLLSVIRAILDNLLCRLHFCCLTRAEVFACGARCRVQREMTSRSRVDATRKHVKQPNETLGATLILYRTVWRKARALGQLWLHAGSWLGTGLWL